MGCVVRFGCDWFKCTRRPEPDSCNVKLEQKLRLVWLSFPDFDHLLNLFCFTLICNILVSRSFLFDICITICRYCRKYEKKITRGVEIVLPRGVPVSKVNLLEPFHSSHRVDDRICVSE